MKNRAPAGTRISLDHLRRLLHYDAESGLFTWLVKKGTRTKVGAEAGSCYQNGYRVISIDKVDYLSHRLAWFYTYGTWPKFEVDHMDGDRANNRITNLRDVSIRVNTQNIRKPHADKKSCQLLGATWDKWNGNWKAQLGHKGKMLYIGRYQTAEAAHAAYIEAKRRIHEGCTI